MYEGEDCFSDEHGTKNTSLPQTHWKVQFFDEGENTKVIIENTYMSADKIEEIMKMGFKEGFTDALDNLDILFSQV
jgi:hypothetical protein